MIFSDEGKSGQVSDRPNFNRLLDAMRRDEVDVVIFFSTSRLFRKQWKALQFIDTEIVQRKKRCIFVAQQIDTAQNPDQWRMFMNRYAELDEMVAKMNKSAIRAAQSGKTRRGEVAGEMTYGYAGEVIPGVFNKRGRPALKLVVSVAHAEWVRKIFHWFSVEHASYREIAARLRREGAPKPERARDWSWRNVRAILENRRYIGDWSYGWTENDWRDNGPQKIFREEPQEKIELPHLRIIDDELFLKAQARLAAMPGAGGRRPRNVGYNDDHARHPLSCFLKCPCELHGWLWLTDDCIYCRRCFEEQDRRVLFSMAPQDVAVMAICGRIAREIAKQAELVEAVVAEAMATAQAEAKPSTVEVDRLEAARLRLTELIHFNMRNPGKSELDRTESQREMERLRDERDAVQLKLSAARAAMEKPMRLPTVAELRKVVGNLMAVLTTAAASTRPDDVRAIRTILRRLIDAPITVTQQGQQKKRLGWLRVHFDLHLERLFDGVTLPGVEPVPISVDLVRPSTGIGRENEIMPLYQSGMPMKEIARQLGIPYGNLRRVVVQHLQAVGTTIADAYARKQFPKGVKGRGNKYLLLEEPIMKLFNAGKLYGEIAMELKMEIHSVGDVIRKWHRDRGLDVPDGRNRRKSLDNQNRRNERPDPA